ncbi:LysR substrate-binding domain-containing protein [Roseobacter sinensis]|uniref:LysR substrate-binding domain-containing protein n=1 Tax=Roseobacter sinensis TaxID=2931391 RepID=A0ABT3BGG8_9RHOB|nr:LysR substrate-binding domain-containing protein [Roseobacter sp. WL0113]MCV3272484.1 LysR substrate-binding domain-containing protein [Roseobacter sp. WL0113]
MQNLNTIPLSALRTIEVIARHGTLRAAAKDLGVTPGALSQRLAKAEAALGQPLFIRSSKGLLPTEACVRIRSRLSAAFTELSAVVAELAPDQGNQLTVSAAPLFASRWLIWRIKRFSDLNPEISLRVLPTLEVVDLDHSEVDVGLRVGPEAALGQGATKLLDQRVFPVCAPELAAQVTTPEDLFRLPVIRETEALHGWKAWLSAMGLSDQRLRPGPIYADAALCLDAAMTGQGVFMAWETLACDALERGQIAAPFDVRAQTGATYWFAVSRLAARKPSVTKFKSWLQAELDRSTQCWRAGPAAGS